MTRRIVTAHEQREMLSPWLIEAADPGLFPRPKKVPRKHPGKGRHPKELIPEGIMNQEELPLWMGRDWRNGDGGAFKSDIRPEIPEVDVPHPSEYMSPEAWAKLESTLKDPVHDPHGVLPDDISFEDIVQGEMSHLLNIDDDDAFEGRWWYPNSHEITKDVSDKTGIGHDRTVAEWSTFSPKNVWDNNVENGMQFSLNYPGRPGKPYEKSQELYGDPDLPPRTDKKGNPLDPVFGMPAMNVDEAMAIRHAPGNSFMKFLTGPKRKSFFRNIMDATKMRQPRDGHNPVEDGGYYEMPINPFTGEPDWRMHPQQSATMDTQHVRMSLNPHGTYSDKDLADLEYKTPKYFSRKRKINGQDYEVGYELQHRAHWEATRRLNAMQQDASKHLIPMQTQAGPWIKFRKAIDQAVKNVKGTIPREPGDLPKSVKPGERPPARGQSLGIGEEGPLTEYDVTGHQEQQQDSAKGYHYDRYQRDHGNSGDPDYSQPPEPGNGHYLEPGVRRRNETYRGDDGSIHVKPLEHPEEYDYSPGKRLPGPRPVIPGTGWKPTPRDPRNEAVDLRTVRNMDHRARKLGRTFLTAHEQREMLSPWIIQAEDDDERKKKKDVVVGEGDSTATPTIENNDKDWVKNKDTNTYHIPGAGGFHNQFNTGDGRYLAPRFNSGGGGSEGTGGGGGGGGSWGGGSEGGGNRTTLPPIDPKSYGSLNEAADAFGKQVNGLPYAYGHYGEDGNSYDCSGLMANVYSLYTGKPMGERPDSFNTASDFEAFGFKPGYAPGAFNIGTNGGEGENGHMAGTLPNGMNLESSSSGVRYGPEAAGAMDPQFTQVYHLPPPPAAAPAAPTPVAQPAAPVAAPTPAAGGAAGSSITGARRDRGMRVITAREKWEMLSPWLIEAGPRKAPLDEDAMVKNILDHFNLVTPDQIDQGRDWYKNAREWAKNIAAKTNKDPGRVYATIAALSPNTDWDSNLRQAAHFLMNYDPSMGSKPEDFLPTIGGNVHRAAQVHDAQTPEEMAALLGPESGHPKIHSFYNNISGKEDYVTIDRWMTRVLLGQNGSLVDADEGAKALSGIGHYDSMANAVRRATKLVNKAGGVTIKDENGKDQQVQITPAQMQAMLWLRARGDQKEGKGGKGGLSTPIPDYMQDERYNPDLPDPSYVKPKLVAPVKEKLKTDTGDYFNSVEDEDAAKKDTTKFVKNELPHVIEDEFGPGAHLYDKEHENRRMKPRQRGMPGYMNPSKVKFVARILREAQLAIEAAERSSPPTTLYRGLAIRSQDLPFDLAQMTGDQLLDHLGSWLPKMHLKGEQPRIGSCWTDRRSLAEEATNRSGHDLRVILKAEFNGEGLDEEQTKRARDWYPNEGEFNLGFGAPVTITGVEVSPQGRNPQYRNILQKPSQRTAMRHIVAEPIWEKIPSDLTWMTPNQQDYVPSYENQQDKLDRMFEEKQTGKWYHVSDHPLKPGDTINPGGGPPLDPDFYELVDYDPDETGFPPYNNTNRQNYVWLSPNLDQAKFWKDSLVAQYLYEVKPGDKPQRWNFDGTNGWVAPHARVLRELTPEDFARENPRQKPSYGELSDLMREIAPWTDPESDLPIPKRQDKKQQQQQFEEELRRRYPKYDADLRGGLYDISGYGAENFPGRKVAFAPRNQQWRKQIQDAIQSGGFTFDQQGNQPTSGYSVSTHPDREKIIPIDRMTPEEVAKFQDENADLLEGHPENNTGGWANKADNNFYLDVPQHDPRLWDAVDTALDNDELAIYDLGRNFELDTEDEGYNPLLAAEPVLISALRELRRGRE